MSKRRRRAALITLLLLIGIFAVPVFLTYREVMQERLNHSLIAAVKTNESQAILDLLRNGADANSQDTSSADYKSVSLWTRLLNLLRGHRLSSSGQFALSLALVGKESEPYQFNGLILRALIEHGADPNRRDSLGRTPLFDVSDSNTLEPKECASLVRLLLNKGADPRTRDNAGCNALSAAVGSRQLEAVKVLVARVGKSGVNARDEGSTALIDAAEEGNGDDPAIVRVLLEAGADPNVQDHIGRTALWKATFNNCHAGWSSPQKMRCLLAHGAQIRGSQMGSLLGWAAKGKKVEAMRILLDAGARVNERDPDGSTPLITAVEPPNYSTWGKPAACVRLLLARRANPNVRAEDGRTPLKVARANQEQDVVALLRQYGARK